MANVKTGLTIQKNSVPQEKKDSLRGMLDRPDIKAKFEELLGKKSVGFVSSLISVCNNNKLLKAADPSTVIAAGAMAATLDLPINQNLGFAYIVPYKGEAQFQLGYKGYIQLAMRTGQYKTINACEVYEGEIVEMNRFTGEIVWGEKKSDVVVGYMAYFQLVNGFEKYLYMTKEEMFKHASTYSQAFKNAKDKSRWGVAPFDKMAIKTVLKLLLSKYGILSIEMQHMATAMSSDGAIIRTQEDGSLEADFEGDTIDGKIVEDYISFEPTDEEKEMIHRLELEEAAKG